MGVNCGAQRVRTEGAEGNTMRRPEILLSELKPSMQLVPEPLRPWSIISDAAAPEDGPHSTGCGPFHFGG